MKCPECNNENIASDHACRGLLMRRTYELLLGGTGVTTRILVDRQRVVQVLRAAKATGPFEYGIALEVIRQGRQQWLTYLTVQQRKWQASISRRPARGRHHDSWTMREKYVRTVG